MKNVSVLVFLFVCNSYSFSQIFTEIDVGLSLYSNSDYCLGDYDNDGDYDLFTNGILFKNENNYFVELNNNIEKGKASWLDYDNDKDIDLIIVNKGVFIYKNNGGDSFTLVTNSIDTLNYHSFDFGDYDNDGDYDIILIGKDIENEPITQIYQNIGLDFISTNQQFIHHINNGNIKFIDFNNDCFLDIFSYGLDFNGNILANLYVNSGFNEFTLSQNNFFKAIDYREINWTDLDNNGELDLILSGWDLAFPFNKIYKNNNSNFSIANLIPGEYGGKTFIFDFNNDGIRDILFEWDFMGSHIFIQTKIDTFSSAAKFESQYINVIDFNSDLNMDIIANNKIYINNPVLNNTKPNPPNKLEASLIGNEIFLIWNRGNDNETPINSLSYNLAVGKSIESVEIISPNSNLETGKRLSINMGNAFMDTTYILRNLEPGKYYWRVQSIDNNYIGSTFSEIDSFEVLPLFTKISVIDVNEVVDIGDIDNDGDLDLFSSLGYYLNENDTFIQANSNIPIRFIFDYNNDNYLDIVSNYEIYKNYGNKFEIDSSIKDYFGNNYLYYNNDGFYDIIAKDFKLLLNISGDSLHYKEQLPNLNGIKKITDFNANSNKIISLNGIYNLINNELIYDQNIFPEFSTSPQLKIADFNNDNLVDIIIHGLTYPDHDNISDIYINTGKGFIKSGNSNIRGIRHGNSAIGDYNNDGLSDIIIGGESAKHILELYTNKGGFIFEKNSFEFEGLLPQQIYWFDYNNDCNLDFIVYGTRFSADGSSYVFEFYKNNGNWPNDPPTNPSNLRASRNGYGVLFDWNEATDPQSTEGGLSYNLRVGTTPNGVDIMSPMSDISSGYRRIPKMGNCQMNLGWRLDSLAVGTYYWSVQAIDQSFMGGAWAPEQTFTISVVRTDFETDTVCLGSETSFSDLTLTSGDPIIEWKWNFGDGYTSNLQNPVHTYATADTFFVQLIAISSQYSDTITKDIIVLPKPTVNFTADIACQGTANSFINTSNSNSLTINSWLWDFGDGKSSTEENPIEHGYLNIGDYPVKLKVIADNFCSDSIEKTITVAGYPGEGISVDGPLVFCGGDSVELSTIQNNLYDYQWLLSGANITGADSSKYKALESGAYSSRITNTIGNCITISDTINVNVSAAPSPPTIIASGLTTFCENDSVILSVTNNPDYSYIWKLNGGAIGTDSSEFIARASGTYSLEVSNSTGCTVLSNNQIDVIVHPATDLPSVNFSGTTTFCEGNFVDLSVESIPSYTYQWKNSLGIISGQTSTTYTANTTEQYYIEVSSSEGCIVNTSPISVTVNPIPNIPSINAASSLDFCDGDSVELSVPYISDLNYQWKSSGNSVVNDSSIYTAKISGIYSVDVTNSFGCSVSSSNEMTVTVNELPEIPTVNLSGPTTFCSGDSVELSVNSNPDYSYQWKNGLGNINGETGTQLLVTSSEQYYLEVSSAEGCVVQSVPVNVTVNSTPVSPTVSLSGLTTYCDSDSLTLSVTDNPDLDYQWLLNGGSIGLNSNSYTVQSSGDYNLRVSNANGCSVLSSNTVPVNIIETPVLAGINTNGATTFCDGLSVELSVADNPDLTYQWMDDLATISEANSNIYNATTSGNYKLKVTNSGGCNYTSETTPVVVNSVPVAPTISLLGSTTYCDSDSLILSVTDNPDIDYQWLLNGGSIGNELPRPKGTRYQNNLSCKV